MSWVKVTPAEALAHVIARAEVDGAPLVPCAWCRAPVIVRRKGPAVRFCRAPALCYDRYRYDQIKRTVAPQTDAAIRAIEGARRVA